MRGSLPPALNSTLPRERASANSCLPSVTFVYVFASSTMARDSRLDHFLRLTATPLQADQVYMLAEYAIEASVVALTSQRFSKDRRYARVGERLRKLGLAICGARILCVPFAARWRS